VKYAVVTFGCRVNQADSIGAEQAFRERGATPAAAEDADVVLVNTCSVTSSADQAARQAIRRIARLNPAARIVVTGCYATRRPSEIAELPHVVRVVPNDDKPRLVPLVFQQDLTTADRFGSGDGSCGAMLEPGDAGRTAFTLRVQTGCAERCSYCIIPATRGRPRSAPIEDVLQRVDRARAAGFKEIVLTGVHLGSYGRDLTPVSSLLDLLRSISSRCGPQAAPEIRFRISSLEPMDCGAEIVEQVAAGDVFAPHFHLPLQHASDRLLQAMQRPYGIADYRTLVRAIRQRLPHASIGSDVIVGFPGETDEDFAELVEFLDASPLTHLHVFPYSDRPGTAAAGRHDKVPGSTVRARARVVREIGSRLSQAFRVSQIGTVQRGLTIEDGSQVVTGNYLKLRVPRTCARNEWVTVQVASEHHGELLGW
jgi:threonylcarbamoyladenosine tRNA methylthiotransferase MtaB